jgi:hypothetical protein
MVAVQDRIKTLVDIMPVQEAERLFTYIINNFHLRYNDSLWEAVAEVEPDEIDRQLLSEMKADPECNDFS